MKNTKEKIERFILVSMLKPINASATVILGIYTFVWGAWIASPFWSVFTQAELYKVLSIILPEWVWGVIAMACGAVIVYGAIRHNFRSLTNGARVSGWHWMMISILYFIGDPLNTGGITALMLTVYSVFIYLNIKVNYQDNPEALHRDKGLDP